MNYFSKDELKCPCCGKCEFNRNTLARLNKLRSILGFPLPVTSGYRCIAYNLLKGYTETHSTGQAVDVGISHKRALKLVAEAVKIGFTGVGIRQKGKSRFIHLDDLPATDRRPRPHIWSY